MRDIIWLSHKEGSGHRTEISGYHMVIWWLPYERYSGYHTGNTLDIIQGICSYQTGNIMVTIRGICGYNISNICGYHTGNSQWISYRNIHGGYHTRNMLVIMQGYYVVSYGEYVLVIMWE